MFFYLTTTGGQLSLLFSFFRKIRLFLHFALEMLGKCRGARKTQELLLSEMVRLGYRGGSVRIGHCRNAAFALELCTELRRRFPGAEVKSYPLRGLCSYYAEHGGIMLGFAS